MATYDCGALKGVEAEVANPTFYGIRSTINHNAVSLRVPERKKSMEEKKTVVVDEMPKTRVFNPEAQGVGSPLTPRALSIEPMGTDSSSVAKVTAKWVEEEKRDIFTQHVIAWDEKLTSGKVNLNEEIQVGIEIAREGSAFYGEFLNLSTMTLAGKAIQIGRVLLTLKKLTRQAGYLWEIWSNNNLSFIKPRQRERCMLLAARPDCYPYIALGVERLELLCSATKNIKDDKDPMGTLLRKYHITFTEDSAESLAEFKGVIDAALQNETLLKSGISVKFDVVKQLSFSGVEVNQSLITRLKETKASGGSEEHYLELLAMNKGKVLPSEDTEKRYQDFNTLSKRLSQTVDYIAKGDQTQLKKINTDDLVRLLEKLQALKNLVIQDVVSETT